MGKPAEALDDVAVALGVVDEEVERRPPRRWHLVGEAADGLHRLILVGDTLRMLQRHVEEEPVDRSQLTVIAAGESLEHGPARHGIGGEGADGPTPDVARHLVEQQNQCEPSPRRVLPVIERATGSQLGKPLESPPNLRIRRRIVTPPQGCLGLRDLGIVGF